MSSRRGNRFFVSLQKKSNEEASGRACSACVVASVGPLGGAGAAGTGALAAVCSGTDVCASELQGGGAAGLAQAVLSVCTRRWPWAGLSLHACAPSVE